jgi:hypothetical protein
MKTNIILVLVLSLALLSFMGTTIAAKTPDLPRDVRLQVLELKADGKFAKADSLVKATTAQMELKVEQAKVQKELAVEQVKAQKELHRAWDAIVRPMVLDSVWVWCDTWEKVSFLATRYNINEVLDSTMTGSEKVEAMKAEIEYRQEFRTNLQREIAPYKMKFAQQSRLVTNITGDLADMQIQFIGLQDQMDELRGNNDSLAERVTEHDEEIANLLKAINENGYSIDAALSVLKTVKTNDHPHPATQKRLEKAQREAAAKGEALQ